NNGFVLDSLSTPNASASVLVDFNATYKGAGTNFAPIVTQNGGKFEAGNCPGTAKFSALVLGPGGINNLQWDINNATGAAGGTVDANDNASGWSLLKAAKLEN